MKSKHIIYITFFAIALMASCKKDYLNRYPLSDISPQNFFKNETDLQLYCNQFYTTLPVQNFIIVGSDDHGDNYSDNMVPRDISQLLAGTLTVPNSANNTHWDWSNIRACNYFLQNYNRADISDSIKNIYKGEVLFFRAYYYWRKVVDYGDVPYISTYITDTSTSQLYAPATPHAQIMDSVLQDINFAVDHLPTPANVPDGRIHKYAALALKARMCLWEGTYRKYAGVGDATPFLQEASSAAEAIMNSGLYSIYTTGHPNSDYYNLFIQEELKNNPEAILSMRYLKDVLMNGVDRTLGENNTGYSKDYVRSFLCTDGLPTSLSPLYKGDDSLQQEIQNRDPRFTQQIATRGFVFLEGDTITLPRIGTSVTSTGYQSIKGRSSSIEAWNANASTYDFFIFRYAETLLIEAEARAELGTCTQEVIDNTINKLRDRVGMPHMVIADLVKDPQSDFPDLPVLLDEIRRERRVELANDGFRLDDIKRWRAGTLINNPATILGMKLLPAMRAEYPPNQVSSIVVNNDDYIRVYPNITARKWDDKMYLYPIPTAEITLNPNLKQNPGW